MKWFSILTILGVAVFGLGALACSSSDNNAANTPVAGAKTQVAGGGTAGASVIPNNTATVQPGQGGGNTTTIDVTEQDYSIMLDTNTVDSGNVTFHITNKGPATHEFVVFKTDLAEDKLPVKDGKVNEDADSLKSIDEVEDIKAGETKDLTVDLEPGKYVVICNITGHYQMGMHAALEVK